MFRRGQERARAALGRTAGGSNLRRRSRGTAEFGATVRIAGGTSVVEVTADPYTARFEATIPGGGGQQLSVTAVDASGNESEATSITGLVRSGSWTVVAEVPGTSAA